jgi:hypothetical protein
MNSILIPQSPIPQQDELLAVDIEVALAEYRNVFNNEYAHLPEIALRYLFLLITANKPMEDVQRFANQMRLELNEQRLDRLTASAFEISITHDH